MSTSTDDEKTIELAYIDIQHDTLVVIEDVEQGTVQSEDIWVSGYRNGSTSVHGRVKVSKRESENGEISLISRDGVQLKQLSKTNFTASIPGLHLSDVPIKYPRQVIHPPYNKKSNLTPPLHINAIAVSPKDGHRIAVAGPDGYLVVLPTSWDGNANNAVELKGHVGDVLHVKWFPSGAVILSSSSDLSIRVWGAKDGINPRTLKGHTRGITSLAIMDVGKEIISASLDGTVRVWDVGQAKEIRKYEMDKRRAVLEMILLDRSASEIISPGGSDRVILAGTATGLEVLAYPSGEKLDSVDWDVGSNMVSMAYSLELGLIATGHTNGTIAIRDLRDPKTKSLFRRNEASVYSLRFDGSDLFVGTAAGLPARLSVGRDPDSSTIDLALKEELAGWEAVGVETFDVAPDGSVWVAGGEGGIRRY